MVFSVVCMSLCPSFPFLEAYSHVWTFFGIAFLWDWNENWPLQVLWPLLSFQVCWHIECSTVTTSSFRIWNSSTGIPSPPLSFFILMFPKARLILQCRMAGFRWVITASWLTGTWRSFLYSFSVYSFHLFLIALLLLRDTTVHKFSLSDSLFYKPVHTKGINLIKLGAIKSTN